MPKILKQRHSDYQVEGIYNMLSAFKEKGRPLDYKIQVDGMDAVVRTNDLELFYVHNDMVTQTSRSVEIFIFKGKSLRCDRYKFIFDQYWYEETNTVSPEKAEAMIQDAIAQAKIQFDLEQFQKENHRLSIENKELKDNCEILNRIIESLEKEKREKNNGKQLQHTIEELAVPFLKLIQPQATPAKSEKMLGALENPVPAPKDENELVAHLKKEFAKTNLTEQDFNDLLFAYHFRDGFANEISRVDKILTVLYENKSKISDIENLLDIQNK